MRYCSSCLTTFEVAGDRCPNMRCGAREPRTGWGRVADAGEVIDGRYKVEKLLALGGAGIAYKVRELGPTGEPGGPDLALKELYATGDPTQLARLEAEAAILQRLKHPNIIECRAFRRREGATAYLVTLFEHGGSLKDHVERNGPLSNKVAAGVLRQILSGLVAAGKGDVIHRDLKPANILLSKEVAKDEIPKVRLADFGIAKFDTSAGGGLTTTGTFLGTPDYAAPEQFLGAPSSQATDVFATGAVLWYMLTGEAPVPAATSLDPATLYQRVVDSIPPLLPGAVAAQPLGRILQDVLTGIMVPVPEDRWTVHEVLGRLSGRPVKLRSAKEPVDRAALPAEVHRGASGRAGGDGGQTWVAGAPQRQTSETMVGFLSGGTDDPLPAKGDDAQELIFKMGEAKTKLGRDLLAEALLQLDQHEVGQQLRSYRSGDDDAEFGVGVAVAIQTLDWTEYGPIARTMLSDKSPAVRAAACGAVAQVCGLGGLKTLLAMFDDKKPSVQVAAMYALTAACIEHKRYDLVRRPIRDRLNHSLPEIRRAANECLDKLEG